MRRVILFIASSLDGFIAAKNDDLSWLFTEGEYGYKKLINSVDTLLMGRKTYEILLTFGAWEYSDKNCYVFSNKKIEDKRIMVSNDPLSITKKLLKENGKDIWLIGGGKLIGSLVNEGLVDEIILSIHPIILGEGTPLFPEIKKWVNLVAKKAEKFDSGLVQLTYEFKK